MQPRSKIPSSFSASGCMVKGDVIGWSPGCFRVSRVSSCYEWVSVAMGCMHRWLSPLEPPESRLKVQRVQLQVGDRVARSRRSMAYGRQQCSMVQSDRDHLQGSRTAGVMPLPSSDQMPSTSRLTAGLQSGSRNRKDSQPEPAGTLYP